MKLRNVILHKPFPFLIFFCYNFSLSAQTSVKNVSVNYFTYPVKAKPALAANFGELRPNHFHMGLDCKTDQKENRPVVASADGYVAKVKIEPYGFGRAIYINHPNGLTTLYAHLNNFFPALEVYVKEQQYKLEQWSIFIDVPEDLLPVKQGDLIAYSGNTGGSQGPHMHFEIRDTKSERVLNPSLFNFPINDNVPPSLLRLAVYNRNLSTYSQTPKLFSLKYSGGVYQPTSPIILTYDKVSFGFSGHDRYAGSTNNNGVFEGEIYFDNILMSSFRLDSISYEDTRYVNAHIDYKLKAGGGPYVQHLSRLPGYPVGVYKDGASDGMITLTDDSIHDVRVVISDAKANASEIQFKIKRNNVLLNIDGSLPDQQENFEPGSVNIFERDDIQLVLDEKALYDSLRFTYTETPSSTPGAISKLHHVQSGLIPVQDSFSIKIKPNALLKDEDTGHVIMVREWGGKTEVFKPVYIDDWYAGKFRNFGNFQLVKDESPPSVYAYNLKENAVLTSATQIMFTIKDNYEDLQNFRARLDGKWLRFSNDKGKTFIYRFDEKCQPGLHELTISVQDIAGNTTTKSYHFTR
jgi:murein DD-endopeptidase MepM/ murein hydrolase activator NlpD